MRQIILDAANRTQGIVEIGPPTGSGKSYAVQEAIADLVRSKSEAQEEIPCILYITPQLKGVAGVYNDLRKQFEKYGIGELFDKTVLRLPSNVDSVIKNFNKYECFLPEVIRFDERTINLRKKLNQKSYYEQQITKRDQAMRSGVSSDEMDFTASLKETNTELEHGLVPKFREVVEEYLKNYMKEKKEQFEERQKLLRKMERIEEEIPFDLRYALKDLQKDPCHAWLFALCPSVYTKLYRIIFMSSKKFYYPCSTLVEKAFSFFQDGFSKGGLLILDEADAIKEDWEKAILEHSEEDIDLWNLTEHLYTSFHGRAVTRDFSSDVIQLISTKSNVSNPARVLQKLENLDRQMTEIVNSYHILQNIKSDSDKIENFFIFHAQETYSAEDQLWVHFDPEKNCNYLISREQAERLYAEKGETCVPVRKIIQELKRIVNYYASQMMRFAVNYQTNKTLERRKQKNYEDFWKKKQRTIKTSI